MCDVLERIQLSIKKAILKAQMVIEVPQKSGFLNQNGRYFGN
jgi:hypothetical protein